MTYLGMLFHILAVGFRSPCMKSYYNNVRIKKIPSTLIKSVIYSRTYIAFPFHKPKNGKSDSWLSFCLALLEDSSIQWSEEDTSRAGGKRETKAKTKSLPAMACQENENV